VNGGLQGRGGKSRFFLPVCEKCCQVTTFESPRIRRTATSAALGLAGHGFAGNARTTRAKNYFYIFACVPSFFSSSIKNSFLKFLKNVE
jgi:hypothetical protein